MGLTLAALLIPLQIFVGDMHGLNTLKHQPQKIAAMEGVWDTERGAPLLLFAVPDDKARTNHFEIAVPRLASLILTHDFDGEIKGLNDFPNAHPPALPLFFAFRIMVGMGMLMLATSWVGWWLYRRAGWQAERAAAALAVVARRHDVLRLGGHRRRLVRDRDRPPAVRRLRPGAHGRRGLERCRRRRSRCRWRSTSRCTWR